MSQGSQDLVLQSKASPLLVFRARTVLHASLTVRATFRKHDLGVIK